MSTTTFTLENLAIRQIVKSNIPYEDRLPGALHKYIEYEKFSHQFNKWERQFGVDLLQSLNRCEKMSLSERFAWYTKMFNYHRKNYCTRTEHLYELRTQLQTMCPTHYQTIKCIFLTLDQTAVSNINFRSSKTNQQ